MIKILVISSFIGLSLAAWSCYVQDEPVQVGTILSPATSCSQITNDRPSGLYWLVVNNGTTPLQVYCDTNRTSCSCNTIGGWMRVASFDMRNVNQNCPDGFRMITRSEPPLRTCERTNPGCMSTTYPVHGVPYSQVCGRVIAYQDGGPNGFGPSFRNPLNSTIDNIYVDGVSITHGRSPRQHIWTFAAAGAEAIRGAKSCPCINPNQRFTGIIPSFVGNDYFCDTGSRSRTAATFHPDDPLWDGAGCGSTSTCCEFNNPPWFCKQLPQPTTDDIELRICINGLVQDEDVTIEIIELFVR